MTKVCLTQRELAGVLAGLRIAQEDMPRFRGMPQFTEDRLRPLTKAEIDTLCERINCSVEESC